MSEGWTINSLQSKEAFKAHIDWRFEQKKFIRIEMFDTARTLDQNAMTFELYTTIGKQIYGNDTVTARRECKLYHGVPIMRRDSDHFRKQYDLVIKPHSLQVKLELMDWLPVTSLMDRAQCSEYVETVMNTYATKGVSFEYLSNPTTKQRRGK